MNLSNPMPAVLCAIAMIFATSMNVWSVTKSWGYGACAFTFMTFIFALAMANMIDRRLK